MNDHMLSPQSLSIEPPRRDRITAISSAVQRRPIVLVVGMHRSGTSLCSHLLSALGVDMADTISGRGAASPVPENPHGHWERWEIVEFHDRILGLFNRDYEGCFHDFALPVAWWADPRVAQIRREIIAFLERRMGDGYFGFKDPRTVRLMPVWHQIFNELKLAPRIVLCLRNPAQVARSLYARDRLDPANGEYRWLVHMIDFYRYTSNFDCCAVEYEEWFHNPTANIEKLQKFLDLPWQQSETDLRLLLSDLIDPTARHDDTEHREAGQPLVRSLYKLAVRDGQDGARDQIAYIVSQFVSFQQLQRPLQQAFEDVARTAAKYPEIEKEATALRAAASERDAAIASADRRAEAAEARLADALAEIDRQRGQIADLGRERDEASSLRATLAESEATLAEHSRRADDLAMALQASQSERGAREAALLRAEQEAQEHAAAAIARQSEIDVLRDTLARAEREAQERAAAAVTLEAELGALRQKLGQAEQEAQERGVSAEAMHAEVAELWDTLMHAGRETQQHEAAATAMRGEITTLRDSLARAEREVQRRATSAQALEVELVGLREAVARSAREKRPIAAEALEVRGKLAQTESVASERATAAAALQAEIATLQDALVAARQVGRAAVAAFRINTVVPVKLDERRGWRQAVTRFLGTRASLLDRASRVGPAT